MSKDVIKKLLQNATEYSNDAEVIIAGQKVTLGDLRALDSDERKTLNDSIAKANKLRDDAIAASARAQTVYEQANEVLEKNKNAAPPAAAAGTDPWATDPWLKPVDERMKKQEAANEELKNLLKQVSTIVGNGMTTFSEARWDDQYNSIDFGKHPRKTRDELLEYAKTNRLVDRTNLPSIRLAWEHMTAPERQKAHEEDLIERGRQRGIQESLASRLPQPNVPGPGMSAPAPKIPANGDVLGDLYGDAVKDPELRQLLEQMGTVGLA